MKRNGFRAAAFAILLTTLFSCGKEPEPVKPGGNGKTDPDPGDTPAVSETVVSSPEQLAALGTLKAGDEIIWEDGEYSGVVFTFAGSGVEGKPIVLRARTPGGVTFKASSGVTLSGQWLEFSGFHFLETTPATTRSMLTFSDVSKHCKAHSCCFDGTGCEPSDTKSHWVTMKGLENEVCNCSFIDKTSMGVMLVGMPGSTPIRHKIHSNYFYRPYGHFSSGYSGVNGQEIIRIGTSDVSMSDAECEVYDNWFYGCVGENGEIISNKSCKNRYYHNLFEYCWGELTLRHGNGCTVEDNYFLGGNASYEGGVRVIGEDHVVKNNFFRKLTGNGARSALCVMQGKENSELHEYFQVKNLLIKGNTFLDCAYAFYLNYVGTGTTLPAVGVTIEDNIVSASAATMYTVYNVAPDAGGITWTGNTIYGGRQQGASVPTASLAPMIVPVESRYADVKSNAGAAWERQKSAEN